MTTTYVSEILAPLLTRVQRLAPNYGKTPLAIPGLFVSRRAPCAQLCGGHERPTVFLQLCGRRILHSPLGDIVVGAADLLGILCEQKMLLRIEALHAEPDMVTLGLALDDVLLGNVLETLPVSVSAAKLRSTRAVRLLESNTRVVEVFAQLLALAEASEAQRAALAPLYLRILYTELLFSSWGPELVARLTSSHPVSRLARAIGHLTQQLPAALSVEELAAEADMSPEVFSRGMKQLLGETALQYSKRVRLLAAREMLLAGELTHERIAQALGYSSTSQFYRDYRSQFGISPKRTDACT